MLLLLAYFTAPTLVVARLAPELRQRMGSGRFLLAMFLALSMLGLPLAMYLRWLFGIRHIVSIPEIPFNL
jgi:hypothetical protein